MSRQFFIADTHFGHKNIIEYENRLFNTTEEMDNAIIEKWNKTIKKMDRIFILGNHDKCYSYVWWNTVGFDMVCAYPMIIDEWFILFHEPLYTNTNMPYVNIFGHVHGNPEYSNFSKQHFCASCERINYTPIELKETTKLLSKL